MHHPAVRRALAVDHLEHLVVGVAVVDDQRLVRAAWRGRCAAGTTRPGRPGRPRRCGSGRGRSRRRHAPCRAPGRGARSRPSPRRGCRRRPAAAPRWGAGRRPATSASCVAATSTAHRAPGRSQPICTIRGTPTTAGGRDRVLRREPVVAVGDVEVAVVVDDRVRQRLGRGRPLPVPAGAALLVGGRPARVGSSVIPRRLSAPAARRPTDRRLGRDPVADALEHDQLVGPVTQRPQISAPMRESATSRSLQT